ncbi:N-6 DNA methylase family protein [Aquimarina pacifica]|uniref:SAM-dependent methyltransferase n=1 Tax=Aquimarina pacifica TaxID=1296415 RepID=UPI000470DAFD|nr:SAM-dependent methyltransferase [Aquimarina pacifica]
MQNRLQIRLHPELNRWELHFDSTPHKDLSDYLESLGFRFHPRNLALFYAPKHDAYQFFGLDLKASLAKNGRYLDIPIRPSHTADVANIVHNKFSYVTITYATSSGIEKKNFVVFDQYKKIAEAIAFQYGKEVYKEQLKSVEAAPRLQKRAARQLLAKGQVIPPLVPLEKKGPSEQTLLQEQVLTNAFGVYTKAFAGDRLEQINIPIPASAQYSVEIRIVRDENDQYRYATSVSKEFGDHSGSSQPISHSSALASSRLEALGLALENVILQTNKHLENPDNILSNQKIKDSKLQKALEAIKIFAKDQGLSLAEHTATSSEEKPVVDQKSASDTIVDKKKEIDRIESSDLQHKSEVDTSLIPSPVLAKGTSPQEIREQLLSYGFTPSFTAEQAFKRHLTSKDCIIRFRHMEVRLKELIKNEYQKRIGILELEIATLEERKELKNKKNILSRKEQIARFQSDIKEVTALVAKEQQRFKNELWAIVEKKAIAQGHEPTKSGQEALKSKVLNAIFGTHLTENHRSIPLNTVVQMVIEDHFGDTETLRLPSNNPNDYLSKVIAIMQDHYMQARRLSRKQIEKIKEEAGVPNMGMLWEAVELSWLLWYKMFYDADDSFENRLRIMIQFWKTVQPTYAYSDSSKELYKQYSTPCPIAAIIAEYTDMKNANSVFEPSAGNGLLVLGANPEKTHVNEIDKNRSASLAYQGFKTRTHFNAAAPIPEELDRSFEVMVTNPPFASWSADAFDKKRMVAKYFNKYRRLDKNRLRLEHLMSGIALHTLKDNGKAALLLMGHVYFDDQGRFAKHRPFFNWLYMHYRVDDIINLNGYTLYNKQGATPKLMLVLISGRRHNPSNTTIAPQRKEAGVLDQIIDSFEGLWQRVRSHIKSPIEHCIQQLKLELGYDIL